ncbi:MAG: magnesium/cobalt transporter CorA [Flavobacteriaceae bacterium]|nr:magnesium/cobalt transporter CorA [Flavobacteriaceae bacterium]
MVNFFQKNGGKIVLERGKPTEINNVIWVDLLDPSEKEKKMVEEMFEVELFTTEESEEIETSSKYIETPNEIGINLNFIISSDDVYLNEPISFILRGKRLITQREVKLKAFDDVYKKLRSAKVQDGDDIFLLILDTRIDFDADLIENVTDKISAISKEIHKDRELEKDILLKITSLQETTIVIRENIIEKQRILSTMLKSKNFPSEDYETMRIMLKDVGSLLDHTSFNFERLEFLQNTFLGLIDMEQNRIIKIFTIVTVIFMPPTLIASMYGMNFKFMPEIGKTWGYPFAVLLMIASSIITLWFFRRKKWI